MDLELTLDDFKEARQTIEGLVHRTPLCANESMFRVGISLHP